MKAMGVRKGVLDMEFLEPRGDYVGLWLEFKVEDNEMDKDQVTFARLARARNWKVEEVRTLERFITVINSYLNLKK